jgi:SAM-dependent methyltransferase
MSGRRSGQLPERSAQPAGITERLEQEFLLASQYEIEQPRHFPRLQSRLTAAWSRLASRAGDLVFEHGIETSGHAHDVPHFHPDRVWYQASGWTYLRRILPRHEVAADDVFLDLGSGKGRILLEAARGYSFARVIGVEISEQLNEIARDNVERRRHRLRAAVEIVTADAAAYEISDDVTVAYMYYPFVGDTFCRVLDNVLASLERRPRRLRLIYALPTMEDAVLGSGVFRVARTVRTVNLGVPQRIVMFEARPA